MIRWLRERSRSGRGAWIGLYVMCMSSSAWSPTSGLVIFLVGLCLALGFADGKGT